MPKNKDKRIRPKYMPVIAPITWTWILILSIEVYQYREGICWMIYLFIALHWVAYVVVSYRTKHVKPLWDKDDK